LKRERSLILVLQSARGRDLTGGWTSVGGHPLGVRVCRGCHWSRLRR
jgi:hypothetical protein